MHACVHSDTLALTLSRRISMHHPTPCSLGPHRPGPGGQHAAIVAVSMHAPVPLDELWKHRRSQAKHQAQLVGLPPNEESHHFLPPISLSGLELLAWEKHSFSTHLLFGRSPENIKQPPYLSSVPSRWIPEGGYTRNKPHAAGQRVCLWGGARRLLTALKLGHASKPAALAGSAWGSLVTRSSRGLGFLFPSLCPRRL